MICALCAAENPNKGRYCLNCGALLQGQRELPPQPYETAGAPYTGPPQTSGKAIGSLICGLLFFFFPVAIVAIILGHLSLGEIRRSAGRLKGSGMAVTGLVLGYTGAAVIPILIIAAIIIPNLLRAKIAANEASAVASLRAIVTAETTFNDSYATGFSPDLATLGRDGSGEDSCNHAGLIDRVLASGEKNGYRFTYVPLGESVFAEGAKERGCTRPGSRSFELHADPITRGTTGKPSFYTDQRGLIRFNDSGPATANSPIYHRRAGLFQ